MPGDPKGIPGTASPQSTRLRTLPQQVLDVVSGDVTFDDVSADDGGVTRAQGGRHAQTRLPLGLLELQPWLYDKAAVLEMVYPLLQQLQSGCL